jgi:hypothetical protein
MTKTKFTYKKRLPKTITSGLSIFNDLFERITQDKARKVSLAIDIDYLERVGKFCIKLSKRLKQW